MAVARVRDYCAHHINFPILKTENKAIDENEQRSDCMEVMIFRL